MKSKKIFVLRAALLVLIAAWCTLIFLMSAETADISSDRSEGLSERIIGFFMSSLGIDGEERLTVIDRFESVLRKGAHVFSYFVLSALTLCFAFTFDKLKTYARVLSAFVFTLIYALSDEIHQLYVEGRAGSLRDVLIDMIGACIGISVVLLINYIAFRKKEKKQRTSK